MVKLSNIKIYENPFSSSAVTCGQRDEGKVLRKFRNLGIISNSALMVSFVFSFFDVSCGFCYGLFTCKGSGDPTLLQVKPAQHLPYYFRHISCINRPIKDSSIVSHGQMAQDYYYFFVSTSSS